MISLYYSALDIAAIISGMDLGCQKESQMIDKIWMGEQDYLLTHYESQRKFILDVRYWMNYFNEKPILNSEFPAIKKDFYDMDTSFSVEEYMADYMDLDLFFKNIRIKILYGNGHDYARVKLRTLLKQYGYKRRSQYLVDHINRCIEFYQFKISLRDGVACKIEDLKLDDMITFRI